MPEDRHYTDKQINKHIYQPHINPSSGKSPQRIYDLKQVILDFAVLESPFVGGEGVEPLYPKFDYDVEHQKFNSEIKEIDRKFLIPQIE